jgi:hypothetical protein
MSISGKKLGCKYGGTPTTLAGNHSWQASAKVDELDSTTGADAGYANFDAGVKELTVTIQFYFDVASGVAADLAEGTVLTNLKLYRDLSDTNPAFTLASALVTQFEQKGEVRGKIECTATVKNKGSYVYHDVS